MIRKILPYILVGMIAVFLGFLIAQNVLFGISVLLFSILVFVVTLNFKIGLVLIIFALLLGQAARFSLPIGGSVVLNDILIPLVFAIWILAKLVKKEIFVYKTPLNWPLGIFILWAIFSLILNPAGLAFVDLLQGSAYLFRFITYALTFYLILDIISDQKSWQKMFSVIIWAGFIFAFLGLLQLIFIPSFESMAKYGWDPHTKRLLSTFFDPNYAGGFLALVSSLVLGRMLFTKSKPEKGILFFGFLALLFAIVFTYSRSAYVAFAVSFLAIGVLKSWRILLFGAICAIIIFFTVPRMHQRILGAFELDVTAKARLTSFRDAFDVIKDYPVFGTGYNTLRTVRGEYGQIQDARQHTAGGFDSSFLTIWAATGILGLLIFLWFCFAILKESFRTFRNQKSPPVLNGLGLGVFAGFLGLIFHSQFVNSLLYPHIMVYLWVTLGLLFVQKRVQNESP